MRPKTLRSKLLLAFLLVGILPIVAIGVMSVWRTRDMALAQVGSTLQGQAESAIDKIDRNLFERYGDVQAFAFHPGARGSSDEIVSAADFYMKCYGIYDLMLVADLEGNVIACNTVAWDGKPVDTSALVGTNVRGQEWFDQCVDGTIGAAQTYVSDLCEDPAVAKVYGTRGLALNYSAPIFDETGKVVRVWSNRASWDRIAVAILDVLKTELAAKGVEVETQILRKDGMVLSDADPESILKLNLAEKGLECAAAVGTGKSGYVAEAHKRTGAMQVNGYAASKGALGFAGYGWGVLVRQDAASASAAATRVALMLLAVCIGIAIVITIVGVRMARSVSMPVLATKDVLVRVAKGDLSARADVKSQDELGDMAGALNTTVDVLQRMLVDTRRVIDSAKEGDLSARVDAAPYEGGFGELCRGFNAVVEAVQMPMRESVQALTKISRGDLSVRIEPAFRGDWREIQSAVESTAKVLAELNQEAQGLIQASREGRLDARGDVQRFDGAYRDLCAGMNSMLDSVARPISECAEAMTRVARGDLSVRMSTQYQGAFNTLCTNVNSTVQVLQTLLTELQRLTQSADDGRMGERANAANFQGGYAELCNGVNGMLDSTVGPIQEALSVLTAVSRKDLATEVTGDFRGDHALLKDSVNGAIASMRSTLAQISRNASVVGASSSSLGKVSHELSGAAENTVGRANSVSAAAEQVSHSLQQVASATEEMNASIRDIASNSSNAARVASQAVSQAEATRDAFSKLAQSSEEVGQVVKLISSIAAQTNLLALNATIEAARAGEAGKGFAVVAHEVKNLAGETARATEEISTKIGAIQNETRSSKSAIDAIIETIAQINQIQNTIASAVEEQSAVTADISRNVGEAASSSGSIAQSVAEVAEDARKTGAGVRNTGESAAQLGELSKQLEAMVASFRLASSDSGAKRVAA